MASNLALKFAYTIALNETYNELIEKDIMPQDFADDLFREQICKVTMEELETFKQTKNCAVIVRKYWQNISAKDEYASLTEIARKHNPNNPSYLIQSWLRSKNTVAFLRIWEKEHNPLFDVSACENLLLQSKTPAFTLTTKQWISRTTSIGLVSKQGKNGGTTAHPDIAMDFQMWLNPELRMNMIKSLQGISRQLND